MVIQVRRVPAVRLSLACLAAGYACSGELARPATVLVDVDASIDGLVEIHSGTDVSPASADAPDATTPVGRAPTCPASATWKFNATLDGDWGRTDPAGNLAIGSWTADMVLIPALGPLEAVLHHHFQGGPDVSIKTDAGHFDVRDVDSVNLMMALWPSNSTKGPSLLVSHMGPASNLWLEWPMTDSWPATQVDAQVDGSWRIVAVERRQGGLSVRWARLYNGKLEVQGTGTADVAGAQASDGWNLSVNGNDVVVSGPYNRALVQGLPTEPLRPAYAIGWSVHKGDDQAKPAWLQKIAGWIGTSDVAALEQGHWIATGDQCSGGPCRVEFREVGPAIPMMGPVALGGADWGSASLLAGGVGIGATSGYVKSKGFKSVDRCWRFAKDGRVLWSRPVASSGWKDPVDVDLTCRTYEFRSNSITVIVRRTGTGPNTQSEVELVAADEFGSRGCAESGPCWGRAVADCADSNPCTSDLCDAAHGGCYNPPLPDGTSCGAAKFCKASTCL